MEGNIETRMRQVIRIVRDLTFQALILLSQYIVSNPDKIPEGRIPQKTSCMNPEDAETIGILEASKVFLDKEEDKPT